MEFPKLGQHCSESTCKQLDFLPMKCDACAKIYCKDHITYTTHSCPESYKKDKQVPVCPLCNTPIPLLAGETADVKVGHHIDSLCQSNPAKERRKIYTNKCSHQNCKTKELIPVQCDKCRLNYCLKHRHELDHSCGGFMSSGRGISQTGAAAVSRQAANSTKTTQVTKQTTPAASHQSRHTPTPQTRPPTTTTTHMAAQSHMTEDEAMAQAIARSLADNHSTPTDAQSSRPMTEQEKEDAMLAAALAESERTAASGQRSQNRQQSRTKDSSCKIS